MDGEDRVTGTGVRGVTAGQEGVAECGRQGESQMWHVGMCLRKGGYSRRDGPERRHVTQV